MRFDKFTTRFQQAFADAQSMAVGQDNPYIEPQHLLLALLEQDDGGTASLLARAGANVAPLKAALRASIGRLPKVEGQDGEVSVSRELTNLLNVTDKEAQKRGDQFIASELFLARAGGGQGRDRQAAQEPRGQRESARTGDRGGARRARAFRARKPKGSAKR